MKERFLIVTDGGGEDFYYHLVKPSIWEEYGRECKRKKHYSRGSVMSAVNDRLFPNGDVYEAIIEKESPDEDFAFFTDAFEVFRFCDEHGLKIVGGIG